MALPFIFLGIWGDIEEKTLAEEASREMVRDKDRIIFVKEPQIILSGGSALMSAHPLVETLELENVAVFLPNTQFAGMYGDKNLFYAPCGMEVKTGFPGLVVGAGRPEEHNNGKGGYISIQNANNMRTITYSNLSEVLVAPGVFLEQGQVLGAVGSSGDVLPEGGCQIGITNQ